MLRISISSGLILFVLFSLVSVISGDYGNIMAYFFLTLMYTAITIGVSGFLILIGLENKINSFVHFILLYLCLNIAFYLLDKHEIIFFSLMKVLFYSKYSLWTDNMFLLNILFVISYVLAQYASKKAV